MYEEFKSFEDIDKVNIPSKRGRLGKKIWLYSFLQCKGRESVSDQAG